MQRGVEAASSRYASLVRDVHACDACTRMTHTHALSAANGPLRARAIFIGEAVGRRGGALTGVPFTRDESARRFASFLALAGVRRDEVFITNAVLCHPHAAGGSNRTPLASEMRRCSGFLARTLDTVEAPLIVALGGTALAVLSMIEPHGVTLASPATAQHWRGRALVAMYHPGRQSTLHRGDAAQRDDWRRLGALLASGAAALSERLDAPTMDAG